MKRRLLLVAVAVLVVFAFAQAAFAGWGGGPRMLSSDSWVNMADTLKLTPEQAQKIQNLQKDHFASTQDVRAKLQQLMFELRSLQWQPGADQATVDAKIKEINDLREQLYKAQQQYRDQMKSLLTDEQLAQMAKTRGFGGGRHGGFARGCFGGGFAPSSN